VEVVTSMPNHPKGRIFPEYRGRYCLQDRWEDVPVYRLWLYACTGAGLKRMFNYGSFTLTSLLGLARAKRPDYIFVDSPPLFLSVPAWLLSRLRGVPMIFNVADLWPDSVRELGIMREGAILRFAEKIEAWSYARSAYVSAVTQGIVTTLLDKKGVPLQRILFLPNGVDIDRFRPMAPDLELAGQMGLSGRKMILYAGTHGYAHGIEFALHAAKMMADDPVQFVFVGDGSEKRMLIDLARQLALKNVTFLDPASPEHVARLYSLAHAGLSTLRSSPLFEGTRPAKIYASMACGKPVIYSGQGEGARLVEQAACGLVVPPEDPQALADVTRTLMNDPLLARQLGENGRRFVRENLGWPALVSDWLKQLADPAYRPFQ